MKTVQKFITNDGKTFNTEKEALKHIDTLISETLFPLADKIYIRNNRTQIATLIMKNLHTFETLIKLDKDRVLEIND